MNESIAITIMNDIITNSSNDSDLINRFNKWISILNPNEIIKLSFIYFSFIYEECLTLDNTNNKIINEIKNNMKEILFIKEVENSYKASIYIYIKYKKENKNLINL